MVQCGTMGTLFSNFRKNYDIYSDDSLSDSIVIRNPTRRKFLLTLAAIISVTILVVLTVVVLSILPASRPRATYDRSNDKDLLKLIEVSEAASKLPKSGKLFCWVQTSTIYHDTRSIAINETWIHRCDNGQLFTSEKFSDSRVPYSTVFAGIPDNYYNLFFKSRYAFHYIYEHVSSEFEWYLKADDDTYVIVENLKSFLSDFNPDEPHYFGYVLKPYLKNGYNAGGAGYVLSRAALKIFAQQLYHNETACPDDIYEDVGIARCLESVGITPEDTRNENGQNRFNTFAPMDTYYQKSASPEWVKYLEKSKYNAFANDLISFHHLSPDEIRLFDILLYRTSVKS